MAAEQLGEAQCIHCWGVARALFLSCGAQQHNWGSVFGATLGAITGERLQQALVAASKPQALPKLRLVNANLLEVCSAV